MYRKKDKKYIEIKIEYKIIEIKDKKEEKEEKEYQEEKKPAHIQIYKINNKIFLYLKKLTIKYFFSYSIIN